uniref:Venom protein n=1 Tax=Ampulex compressa TaxID=860918 RepID=A0A1W6EVP3_AMPCP|nr:venom protein [Ampulex compressa]
MNVLGVLPSLGLLLLLIINDSLGKSSASAATAAVNVDPRIVSSETDAIVELFKEIWEPEYVIKRAIGERARSRGRSGKRRLRGKVTESTVELEAKAPSEAMDDAQESSEAKNGAKASSDAKGDARTTGETMPSVTSPSVPPPTESSIGNEERTTTLADSILIAAKLIADSIKNDTREGHVNEEDDYIEDENEEGE